MLSVKLIKTHHPFHSRILGPGSVASVRFPTDKDSQRSKGYAFVDIHRVSDAKRVSACASAGTYVIEQEDAALMAIRTAKQKTLSLRAWNYQNSISIP